MSILGTNYNRATTSTIEDKVNGEVQMQPGSVAGTSVPQLSLLEGPPVQPLKFSFWQLDADRQQMQSQIKILQEKQNELADGQKIIMAFFEKFLEIRQRKICQLEIVRDPMTSIPVVVGSDPSVHRHGNMSVGVQVLESSHRSIFLRLEKQVLLDNQTEGIRPKDIAVVVYRPAVSQEVLSSASVTGTSRWRYPRISPECLLRMSLEERLGQNLKYSPDPPTRRAARLPGPPRHREGRVEDRPADLRRVEVQRRVEDYPADRRIIKAPTLAVRLPRLDLTEEMLLDRIEERLHLRR